MVLQPTTQARRPIDWSRPICTSHDTPLVGVTAGNDAAGRHLVMLPSLSVGIKQAPKNATTYRYDETGNCSVVGEPNIFDLVNFESSDDRPRIHLDLGR